MKKGLNAQEVLRTVEVKIEEIETVKELGYSIAYRTRLKIKDVYSEMSIFDWWNETLSLSQLKDMRKFLKEAIKLGYTGADGRWIPQGNDFDSIKTIRQLENMLNK